jgi:hypothetical protein
VAEGVQDEGVRHRPRAAILRTAPDDAGDAISAKAVAPVNRRKPESGRRAGERLRWSWNHAGRLKGIGGLRGSTSDNRVESTPL